MGSTADQYQDRPAGILLWFVLVCRVMPRSLMFQDKLQLYKAKSSIFNSCFFILLYMSTGKWSLICSGFIVNDFTGPRSTSASPSVAHN